MRLLAITFVLAIGAPAHAAPKLTLEQLIAKAVASPRVQAADADRDAAAARVDEADAARYPRIRGTAAGTVSPKIVCEDPLCLKTSPKNFAFRFSGLFGTATLEVTQPVYTFGKIAHARAAARAGLDAQTALADEAAGDVALDAARAYWGIKLSRELGAMLDDGIEEIGKSLERLGENNSLSIPDRQRIVVLIAEAKTQRIDAAQAEAQALAGMRALAGSPDAEPDDSDLEPVAREIPTAAIGAKRPQVLAAKSGASAADELVGLAKSAYWPDFAVVGSATIAGAQGADDPPSVFANDPYNRSGFGVVLAMQWTIEPWNVGTRVDRARADARKARAQSELAAIGASYDGQTAVAEAIGARDRLAAAGDGEKAARTWLAAVVQSEAIGVAEPREIADAYLAWFQMRARYATAVFQWNVAVVRLDRAAGVFHASR